MQRKVFKLCRIESAQRNEKRVQITAYERLVQGTCFNGTEWPTLETS
jgi:hypothetical protein